jgi:hypothetical protein
MLLQECALGQVRIEASCFVESVKRQARLGLESSNGLAVATNDPAQSSIEDLIDGARQVSEFEFVAKLRIGNTRANAEPNIDSEIVATYLNVRAKSLVIATGGLSIPKIGASDFGYRIARQFGHTVVPTEPSLVPLTFDAKTLPSLPGLALPVQLSCASVWSAKGQQVFSEDLLSQITGHQEAKSRLILCLTSTFGIILRPLR